MRLRVHAEARWRAARECCLGKAPAEDKDDKAKPELLLCRDIVCCVGDHLRDILACGARRSLFQIGKRMREGLVTK